MKKNVIEYLEHSAEQFPDKTAFADPKESVTFHELREQARAIGSGLLDVTGGRRGERIAVAVDRTVRSLVAFLGVVYSGCCYVPIDVQMPVDRMKMILETAQPAAMIDGTGKRHLPEQLQEDCRILSYGELVKTEYRKEELDRIFRNQTDLDPLYILFTSGSTGKPKGVSISHRSILGFTDWLCEAMNITSEDVLGNQAPFYFDVACKDIYLALKCGCTVHILPHMLFSFTGKLMKKLNEAGITTIFWAAAAIRMVASSGALEKNPPRFLKKIGFGGEALPVCWLNAWKKVLPDAVYMNMYGPTETTVDCLFYVVDREFTDGEDLPLGCACSNMRAIVLDEDQREVTGPGEQGELCISGTCVGLGYYNDPLRTAESFRQNPLNQAYPETLYYTGDLVKYGKDGLLYFIGRKDNQVKHMGYRIELGEIETKVTSLPGIEASVCIFDSERDEIILFYQGEVPEEELKVILSDRLPRYMLPNGFIRRETLPCNANNKIDRVRLKEEYLNGSAQRV